MTDYPNTQNNPAGSIPVYIGDNPGGSQPSPTSQGDEFAAQPVYLVPAPDGATYPNMQGDPQGALPVRFVIKPTLRAPFPNDQGNDDSAIPVYIVPGPNDSLWPNQKWNPLGPIPIWDVGEMQPGTPQPSPAIVDGNLVWGSEYVQSPTSTTIQSGPLEAGPVYPDVGTPTELDLGNIDDSGFTEVTIKVGWNDDGLPPSVWSC